MRIAGKERHMAHGAQPQLTLEGPLNCLPRKPLLEFAQRQIIYNAGQPSDRLFVVLRGRVKIAVSTAEGCETIARIVLKEGLFGESCLITSRLRAESASALDAATVMAWTREELDEQINREPRLGIALIQFMTRNCIEQLDRIESMAVYQIPERVLLALLRFSSDIGVSMTGGATRITPLTHETIAEYVGTSREIVTSEMNRLRTLGLLDYSRKFIDLYPVAIVEEFRRRTIPLPRGVIARFQHAQ
jgi:CRP/FNR family transcriptional regulator, cyclic AMP receptor protein